jgi:probable F420-dependent oxidoreductase
VIGPGYNKTVQIGISTPIVTQPPTVSSEWEKSGTPADLSELAQVADRLGFDHLTCSEHVAIPAAELSRRGDTYWDPLATLAFLAAHTKNIRLATSVLVLGYHHPLAIAKRYGTLDLLSGGRLVLGVGVGSAEGEFELLGAEFAGRGARADDAVRALRAALSKPRPQYVGSHYHFSGYVIEPHATQTHVPIWIGGRTQRSLRRAVELADGWMPFGLATAELAGMLERIDLPPRFDVVLPTGHAVNPIDDPARTSDRLSQLKAAGATAVTCAITARSATHYCEQLAALAELARPPLQ